MRRLEDSGHRVPGRTIEANKHLVSQTLTIVSTNISPEIWAPNSTLITNSYGYEFGELVSDDSLLEWAVRHRSYDGRAFGSRIAPN
jgi:hypothetical protein